MPTPHGATARTLVGLTLGVAKSMQQRVDRDAEVKLQEITQQFQVEISGMATTGLTGAAMTIVFDYEFYFAPGQRDSDLTRPHFYFGADIMPDDLEPDDPEPRAVVVLVTVTRWLVNEDNGAFVGANIVIGVMAGSDEVPFNGRAHLSFQGFSALTDVEVDFPDVA